MPSLAIIYIATQLIGIYIAHQHQQVIIMGAYFAINRRMSAQRIVKNPACENYLTCM
jgi:hypothetical protein